MFIVLNSLLAMLSNKVVSGVMFALPATKIRGDLDILFCVLDVNLSMPYTF
jgi:hypothetical protein